MIAGIGSSTLKSLRDMQAGMHWQYAGRQGEQAAGNGAAMRIAPLAFVMKELDKEAVEQVARITHRNDEAYAGALAVAAAIHFIINEKWNGEQDLLSMIAPVLPDTLVKDRVQELAATKATITEAAKRYGASGYVAESVPLALFAASKINETGFDEMMQQLIAAGGDTDTNCSIAGQVAGAATGMKGITGPLLRQFGELIVYDGINKTINAFIERIINAQNTHL